MLSNDRVRKDLINYLKEFGVKNKFIAKKVDLSDVTISLFLSSQRDIAQDKLEKIDRLINGNHIFLSKN